MTDLDPAEWMKATTAAKLLDVHLHTIYRWVSEGRIRAAKLGRRWVYVHRADIAEQLRPVPAINKRTKLKPKPPPKVPDWVKAGLDAWGI